MKYCLSLCTVFFSLIFAATPALSNSPVDFTLKSPSGELVIGVKGDDALYWYANYKGKSLVRQSKLDLLFEGGKSLTHEAQLIDTATSKVDKVLSPAVPQKSSSIREAYNGAVLRFANNFSLELRAYDDGVAYRFVTHMDAELLIQNEVMSLALPEGVSTLFPEEDSIISHNERLYIKSQLADIEAGRFASLPIYFQSGDTHVVFTEADLFDYPAMYMKATGDNTLEGLFPEVVISAKPMLGSEDRNEVLESADYIAVTQGDRRFPWRLAVVSDRPGALVESELVYLLSRENKIKDTSWIKPGRVAWDWYNANNLYGIDFKAGLNTETYKYYIDFAAEYGLEYIILDEGWTLTTTNTKESNPDLDVHELVAYGKKRGVEIILWTLWKPLDNDYKNILKLYASWGVAGIKVDFMQRSDQYMVSYYEKIAAEAARNKLLVDFHGAFKPTGLGRTWPNVVSYEGVKGNENNKWSKDITPEHNVTIPFIRMVAGPMDYTPGAMRNAQGQAHNISHFRPMSLGTRAHQVAMYAVYESPLQMLCDSPSHYYREPDIPAFIAQFPSVWDETRVLMGEVADYIIVARRSGKDWYIGAMTDATAREFEIDLGFLGKGKYKMEAIEDGLNVDNFAQDYAIKKSKVSSKSKITIKLASGGGWAAVIKK